MMHPLPDCKAARAAAMLRQRRRCLCTGLGLAGATMLGGCAAAGAGAAGGSTPGALMLDLWLVASAAVNPNEQGQPAPILVRVYELAARDPFDTVDYFSLASDDKAALGASFLQVEEWVLRPGERRRLQRKAAAGMAVLGVTAAYRDLPRAVWRASREVPQPRAHWFDAVLPTPVFRAEVRLGARAVEIVVDR
jgi:type VI secretion system protein VasD